MLELDNLSECRKRSRHDLLITSLSNEALSYSCDELMNTRPPDMAATRAVSRGEPQTIYAKSSAYHNSFLPRSVREMKTNH